MTLKSFYSKHIEPITDVPTIAPLMAGVLIGMGDIILMTIENKYVGSVLFSLGLLSIIKLELPLFTGRIGYLNQSFISYTTMFTFNIFGCLSTVYGWGATHPELEYAKIRHIAEVKFSDSLITLFLEGVFCGICMYCAVASKNKIITVFAVSAFILGGGEHCIADSPYLVDDISGIVVKYFMIVLGNTVGSVLMRLAHIEKDLPRRGEY